MYFKKKLLGVQNWVYQSIYKYILVFHLNHMGTSQFSWELIDPYSFGFFWVWGVVQCLADSAFEPLCNYSMIDTTLIPAFDFVVVWGVVQCHVLSLWPVWLPEWWIHFSRRLPPRSPGVWSEYICDRPWQLPSKVRARWWMVASWIIL